MAETTPKPCAFAFIVSEFQHELGNLTLFLAQL